MHIYQSGVGKSACHVRFYTNVEFRIEGYLIMFKTEHKLKGLVIYIKYFYISICQTS